MTAAVLLEERAGRRSAAAGGEHRIHHDHVALGDIGRELAVIFDRFEGLRVTVQADVTDLAGRDHCNHAVDHAETGAEDGDDGKLLARKTLHRCLGNRRFDLNLFQRKVAGRLIAHQHGDLADKLAEFLHARVLVTQDRQLVLDQRVVEYMQLTHFSCSFVV